MQRIVLVVCALGAAVACKEPAPPAPAAETAPATLAAPASAPTAPSAAPAVAAPGERYVGAVGGSLVHAQLLFGPSSVTGRWFYEKGGKEGLRITSTSASTHAFEARESTDDGALTGTLSLSQSGDTWSGVWKKPGKEDGPEVQLTRELRSKHGAAMIFARTLLMRFRADGAAKRTIAGFLPRLEGPGTEALARTIGLPALLDQKENELDATTELDFTVDHHDARLVTFATSTTTLGAYPLTDSSRRTFVWSTGARVGLDALLPAKRKALVALLDARVQAAWNATKKQLAKPNADDSSCGADVLETFANGAVAFPAKGLADLSVDAKGVTFAYDFGWPHVVAACEPTVDLALTWVEMQPFVDPTGPLAGMH